jgi:hypothetical protein
MTVDQLWHAASPEVVRLLRENRRVERKPPRIHVECKQVKISGSDLGLNLGRLTGSGERHDGNNQGQERYQDG